MRVSGQRHAPVALYPRGKDRRYPLYRRLGGPQSRSGHRGYRKNPLPSAGDRSWIVRSLVRSQTLYWLSYPAHSIVSAGLVSHLLLCAIKVFGEADLDIITCQIMEIITELYVLAWFVPHWSKLNSTEHCVRQKWKTKTRMSLAVGNLGYRTFGHPCSKIYRHHYKPIEAFLLLSEFFHFGIYIVNEFNVTLRI
jgi:hypothetical protein